MSDKSTWSIGKRLRVVRRRLGWTQERMARKLVVSTSSVSHWEQEVRVPTGIVGRYVEERVGALEARVESERVGATP